MEEDPPSAEFIAQAIKYYKAVLESKKKCWRAKHPDAKRGRPRKVAPEGGGGVGFEKDGNIVKGS